MEKRWVSEKFNVIRGFYPMTHREVPKDLMADSNNTKTEPQRVQPRQTPEGFIGNQGSVWVSWVSRPSPRVPMRPHGSFPGRGASRGLADPEEKRCTNFPEYGVMRNAFRSICQ